MWGGVSWMIAADDRILRELDKPSRGMTRGNVALNTSFHPSHITRRLRILERAGLVESVEREGRLDFWRLSDLGEQYVDDRLREQEIEDLLDEDDLEDV